MPRFPDSKIFFIHIPKTAGSSIEVFFLKKEKNFPNGDIGHNPHDPAHQEKYLIQLDFKNQRCSYQHLTYCDLKKKVSNIDKYWIFTVVRNPYDRVVNDFHYFTKCKPNNPHLFRKISRVRY